MGGRARRWPKPTTMRSPRRFAAVFSLPNVIWTGGSRDIAAETRSVVRGLGRCRGAGGRTRRSCTRRYRHHRPQRSDRLPQHAQRARDRRRPNARSSTTQKAASSLRCTTEPGTGRTRPDRPDHAAGDHRHRGQPVLRARRPRHRGHLPRRPAHHRRAHPRRLLHHPAVRQKRADRKRHIPGGTRRSPRNHPGTQDPRTALRHRARTADDQRRNPRGLPQHRLLRGRRLRCRVRGPALLQRQRQRTQPQPGCHPGRSRPLPRAVQPRLNPTRPKNGATWSSTGWSPPG